MEQLAENLFPPVNLFGGFSVASFEDMAVRLRMENWKRVIKVAAAVFVPFLLSACFGISIQEDVKNPSRYFKRARSRIEEIQSRYSHIKQRPHHVHLLIYEGSDCKLVRLSVPLWLVNGCLELGMEAAEKENEFDFEDRYDFDWRAIKDLGQFGKGLLVEVEDEEDWILIWLE